MLEVKDKGSLSFILEESKDYLLAKCVYFTTLHGVYPEQMERVNGSVNAHYYREHGGKVVVKSGGSCHPNDAESCG